MRRVFRRKAPQQQHRQPSTRLPLPFLSTRDIAHPSDRLLYLSSGHLTIIRATTSRLMASQARSLTPPEGLVSSFVFRTSRTSDQASTPAPLSTRPPQEELLSVSSSSSKVVRSPSTELHVKEWEGRAVFTDIVPHRSHSPSPGIPATDSISTPRKPILSEVQQGGEGLSYRAAQGTAGSPISVSSSSSPERDLPRPRAKARYITRLSSTAYTPPRPLPPSFGHTTTSQCAANKSIHPFFQRDLTRSRSTPPPPPSQRPRLVAYYSSTSASSTAQSSQRTQSESQGSTWSVSRTREIELITHTIETRRRASSSATERSFSEEEAVEEIEERPRFPSASKKAVLNAEAEVEAMMGDLSLGGSRVESKPARKPLVTPPLLPPSTTVKGKAKSSTNTFKPPNKVIPKYPATNPQSNQSLFKPLPRPVKTFTPPPKSLPLFSYRDACPPPKVVFTSNLEEANDLLSCLQGNIMGFDLEWPMHTHTGPGGRKLGIEIDPVTGARRAVQPKTALMQVCDEKMVVLVQVWGMPHLPSKAIEILQNKSIYKLGVQIRGDGQKLLRDWPKAFPEGINSLLELSLMARRADPIGTGPGNVLIALAKLVATYLRKDLPKGDARKSNWTSTLTQEQLDYAANDVVCSTQLFRALQARATEDDIPLDLDQYCHNLGLSAIASLGPPAASLPVSPVYSNIPPRQQQTIAMFKQGSTLTKLADDMSIKINTVQEYIMQAISALPRDTLTVEEKTRLLSDVPDDAYVRRRFRSVFKWLREDVGEEVSESEKE